MSLPGRNIFLRNFDYASLLLNQQFRKPINIKYQWLLLVSILIFAGCSTKSSGLIGSRQYNKSGVWKQSNSRINKYVSVYSKNKHVKTCLDRATSSRYLYYIHRVFYQYQLPPELAHLQFWNLVLTPKLTQGMRRVCGSSPKQLLVIMD